MLAKFDNIDDINGIRQACVKTAILLEYIYPFVKEGVSTNYLDKLCYDYIINKLDCKPACLNYEGYPKSICTSLNDTVCHGIPSEKTILKSGDIVNIDVALEYKGYYGDSSIMVIIGNANPKAIKLVKQTRLALFAAIDIIKPGIHLGNIGSIIAKIASKNNYGVVYSYTGHGIGTNMHMEPIVMHIAPKNTGIIIEENMVFTIEPMINMGKANVKVLKDGWTVKTSDGSLSAQWEHTILVTSYGCEILTLRENESLPSLI